MATLTEHVSTIPMAGHIRPFVARRDLKVVADLIEIGFADTLDDDGHQYLQQMRRSAQILNSSGWGSISDYWSGAQMSGYVWEDDGRVVGNLSLIPYTIGMQRYFLIANVVTLPEYRRRGIGRQLTMRGIAHARQAGARAVWLQVREENFGAVTLYKSLGFIERSCRTTWRCHSTVSLTEVPADKKILPCQSKHWNIQRQWLHRNYPSELTWHLPIRFKSLQPGLLGALIRCFTNVFVLQWVIEHNGRPQAAVSWQSTNLFTGVFWLAAPPDVDESALNALLLYAQRNVPQRKNLVLDYPARQSESAIEQSGFQKHQTLIWMSITF